MQTKTIKRALLWALVIFSIASLVFTPLGPLKDDIIQVLPWFGVGVVATEVLFIGGLAMMAASMGVKFRNPLRLRRELKSLLAATTTTKMFWFGFWINAAGAVASSIVLGAGILMALPPSSWGVLSLVVVDITATVVIRGWVVRAHARERGLS
ncbi:MAG TPA: hypothetical protein VGE13_00915 [Candidatus Saccharimonadales bacterium]